MKTKCLRCYSQFVPRFISHSGIYFSNILSLLFFRLFREEKESLFTTFSLYFSLSLKNSRLFLQLAKMENFKKLSNMNETKMFLFFHDILRKRESLKRKFQIFRKRSRRNATMKFVFIYRNKEERNETKTFSFLPFKSE